MNFKLHSFTIFVAALVAMIVVACSGELRADAESVEVRELRAALVMSQQQLLEARADAAIAEQRRKELIGSLSESVRVSEEQVARAREIELKLQAFGVDLLAKEENGLEQRLLKAVRDLDISQQELEACSSQLQSLSEGFLAYLAATPDASGSKRDSAQKAISRAGEVLSGISTAAEEIAPGDLSDSQIVSIDSEIGLVVLDAGRRAGLRVGTPISILREDRPIYSAMIIDVRDSIAGAVLQDRFVDTETVAVGDGVKLLPNQSNL